MQLALPVRVHDTIPVTLLSFFSLHHSYDGRCLIDHRRYDDDDSYSLLLLLILICFQVRNDTCTHTRVAQRRRKLDFLRVGLIMSSNTLAHTNNNVRIHFDSSPFTYKYLASSPSSFSLFRHLYIFNLAVDAYYANDDHQLDVRRRRRRHRLLF